MKCYTGYANDAAIRYRSSSGGVVRQALTYLLGNRIVDGALIVKQEYPRFYTDIATTVEELDEMEGSIYAPVAYGRGLRKMKDGKKYVIVGLPCQIRHLPHNVRDRVFMAFGLFCRGTPRRQGTEFFLRMYGIRDVLSLRYRGHGWPGMIEVRTKGRTHLFDRKLSMLDPKLRCVAQSAFGEAFRQERCFRCEDRTCRSADVSCGDAWMREFSSDALGTNIVVSRTERGERLLRDMKDRGLLSLTPIPPDRVEATVRGERRPSFVDLKRRLAATRLDFLLPVVYFVDDYVLHFPWHAVLRKLPLIREALT